MNDAIEEFEFDSLAINLAAVLAILGIFLVMLEWRIYRRGSLASWSVRELLVLVFVIAAPCSWWRYKQQQWLAEQEVIQSLPSGSCDVSQASARPAWVTRIAGRERLMMFDRVRWVYWPSETDDRELTSLAEPLSAFKSLEGMSFDSDGKSDAGLAAVLGFINPPKIDIPSTRVTGTAHATVASWMPSSAYSRAARNLMMPAWRQSRLKRSSNS